MPSFRTNQSANLIGLYSDDEVKKGVEELFSNEKLIIGMKAFLPNELSSKILERKDFINNSYEFQKEIVHPLLQHIVDTSTDGLFSEGIAELDKNKNYLFISNHRDIGLDPAFVNFILFENNFSTGQIAIGDNLMKHRVAELIFRINKSFVVKRSGGPREIYKASVDLSNYIFSTINNQSGSIWLAQRQGRAKDGDDKTQQGLIKMLGLSNSKNIQEHLSNLNIVPVAITYEYDPCDHLKVKEHVSRTNNSDYKKTFDEDIKSLLQGMKGNKGRVNVNFGQPISESIKNIDENENQKLKLERIVKLIDDQIHNLYQLNPINYLSYDLLHKSELYSSKYTEEQKEMILQYLNQRITIYSEDDLDVAKEYLLKIYANPVINKMNTTK